MKTIFALLTAASLTILLGSTSVSQSQLAKLNSDVSRRAVSYLGTKNEMLVFEVNLNIANNEVKTLSIYDEAGNEIHTERIRTNVFTKQFMFAKNATARLQFKLRGKKEIMNETFDISYKTQETLEITRS